MSEPVNVINPLSFGLGRILALIGLVLVIVLFVVGKMVGIEAGLFALAFLAILL